MEKNITYPWPASALTDNDMKDLHREREQTCPRIPITRLIAIAVRQAYGAVAGGESPEISQRSRKEPDETLDPTP